MTKPKRQMPLLRGGTDGLLTHRWSGMDSNVQFRAINSSWLRPSWGRSTGARSSEQFGDLGEPIDLSGGVRRAATHRPDQAASHQGRAVGGASASRKQRFESVPLEHSESGAPMAL